MLSYPSSAAFLTASSYIVLAHSSSLLPSLNASSLPHSLAISLAISKSLLLSPNGLTSGFIANRYSLVEFAISMSVLSYSSAAGRTMSLNLAVLVQNGSQVMIALTFRIAFIALFASGCLVKVEPLALNITLIFGSL